MSRINWPHHIGHNMVAPSHPWPDVLVTYPGAGDRELFNLKHEVNEPSSPVRQFLRDRFPETGAISRQYKEAAAEAPLLVPNVGGSSQLLGMALDHAIKAQVGPVGHKRTRDHIFRCHRLDASPRLRILCDIIVESLNVGMGKEFLSYCVNLATLQANTYVSKSGPTFGDACHLAFELGQDSDRIMSSDDVASLDELARLVEVAQEALLPYVASARHVIGEVEFFDDGGCDGLFPAVADLWADYTLIELKASVPATKAGNSTMRSEDVRQLLGYILRDWEDDLQLERVAYYQGRFGQLVVWDIDQFVDTAAGQHVDLNKMRADFRDLALSGVPRLPLGSYTYRLD